MTRQPAADPHPTLPATRDERIALARRTIAGLLVDDDQLDPEDHLEFGHPAIVGFRCLCATSARAHALALRAKDALKLAGFAPWSLVVSDWHDALSDGWLIGIRVPVGAP